MTERIVSEPAPEDFGTAIIGTISPKGAVRWTPTGLRIVHPKPEA